MNHQPGIVFLASQQGSLFEKIAKACEKQIIKAQPLALISSREGAPCISRAQQLGLPVEVVSQKAYSNSDDYDQAMLLALKKYQPDWILLAGFMSKLGGKVLQHFPKKIINTHPSLLPKFGGSGMYGIHVHRAIIAAGEKTTGITIHQVTANYDEGKILAQKEIEVVPGESADDLQARVKIIEGDFYIDFLKQLIESEANKNC